MKKDGRSVSRETLEQYRFRALELRDKGWKVNKIEGKNSLKSKKARGKEPKINLKERIQIIEWLKEDARSFGFPTPLWTCKQVQILIKKRFEKTISISNVWELLRKANL